MRLRTSRLIITAIVLALGFSATTSLALGAARVKPPSRPKLLTFNFKLIARGWLLATSEERYLLVTSSFQAGSSPEVIDDTSHQAFGIPVPAPGCTALGLSGSRAVFNCGTRWQPDVRAYSFTEDVPQPVPQISSGCVVGDVTCGTEPVSVGSDWIEYQTTPCYHCPGSSSNVFQSLDTGTVVTARLTARTIANLDRPQLTQPVCAPLRVPSHGSIVLAGRFALATSPVSSLIEKCGASRPVMTIPGYIQESTVQQRAIIWQRASARTLSGIDLPSLRRFSSVLPKRIFAGAPELGTLFLTDRTLYVQTYNEATQQPELWAAPASRL